MTAPEELSMARTVRLLVLVVAAAVSFAALVAPWKPEAEAAEPPTVDGFKPFSHWPQDRKPDAVLVLTGQTYGYLSPCGCSRPQRGGLERRANFMQGLRDKGWPVVGLDLGDIAPPKKIAEQDLLKYKTQMEALKSMGYVAVGLGDYDFNQSLFELLGAYTLNQPSPVVLGANVAGSGAAGAIERDKACEALH
jgi:hypothetical protein